MLTSANSQTARELFLQDPCYFKTQKGSSHKRTPDHKHNYMQLWYVLNGSFLHVFNDHEFFQKAGDLLIVPPFFPHTIDTSNSINVEFIFCDLADGFLDVFPNSTEKETLFNLAYIRPLVTNANQMRPFLTFSGEAKQQIEAIYLELLEQYKTKDTLSTPYIRSNVVRLLTLIAQQYQRIAPSEDDILFAKYRNAIQNALDYIDQHYFENITLDQISKIALMSVRSFSYVFKQITGKTFLEYIHYLRIYRARQYLINSDYSIGFISDLCGFCNIAHFTRIFKKMTGIPPATYRKEYWK